MDHPFDALADSDAFERLVYDLLEAEEFHDLVWRGPGADGGRDIEATWSTVDPIGGALRTRWYIECKWYTESVPFADIEPKLLAATVSRVEYLLIATSARVRTTAMDDIVEWLERRGQPFRVRYWTGEDILRLVVRHSSLFEKHFAGVPTPAWGSSDRERQRLAVMLGTSTERLAWRILPAVQLLANELPDAITDPSTRAKLEGELDFISCMLRGHDTLSLAPTMPSRRRVPLVDCVTASTSWLAARGKQIQVPAIDAGCVLVTSPPLLKCALFELLHNAIMYQTDNGASIEFDATHKIGV